MGIWRTRYGLGLLAFVTLGSVLIFAAVSENGDLYSVPRYISHITNKIRITTNSDNHDYDEGMAMFGIRARPRGKIERRRGYANFQAESHPELYDHAPLMSETYTQIPMNGNAANEVPSYLPAGNQLEFPSNQPAGNQIEFPSNLPAGNQLEFPSNLPAGNQPELPTNLPTSSENRMVYEPVGIQAPVNRPTGNYNKIPTVNRPFGPNIPKAFDYSDMTSPRNSRIFIKNRQPVYAVGDNIKILIQTFNDWNHPKNTGGDIIRAHISTPAERAGASTNGEVVDLGNGWYEADFTLRWPGVCTIEVTLVHPVEALRVVQDIAATYPAKMAYIATFVRGLVSETRRCNIMPPEFGPMCNFSHPTSGVEWYCQPPRTSGLSCDDWRWSQSDEPATGTLIRNILRKYDDGFPLNRYREQISTSSEILVQVPYGQDIGRGMYQDVFEFPWQTSHNLPSCQPGQHIGKTAPSGYFYHDTWYSLHCHIRRRWTLSNITECLRNTSIHMIGDSSGRQIFTLMTNTLGSQITSARTHFLHESEDRSGPRWTRDDVNGIRLLFNFHAFPIGGSNWFNRSNILDAVTRLDAIRSEPAAAGGTDRVVIIMTIGAHFTYHDLACYEARLRAVKRALDRLMHRIPDALVIFKSMTAREYSNVFNIAVNGEWWMWRMDQSMREIIASDPRIALIDAWDMTKAMLFPYNVHPHDQVISNFASHILSYICPTDNKQY